MLFHLRRVAAEKTLNFSARAFSQSRAPTFNAGLEGGVVGAQPGIWTTAAGLPSDPIATGDPKWQQASAVTQFSLPLTDAGSDVLLRLSPRCSDFDCPPPSALMIGDLTLE